ncbi:hypothetical protein EMCRGX_G000230 [Ephydatia muelleri]
MLDIRARLLLLRCLGHGWASLGTEHVNFDRGMERKQLFGVHGKALVERRTGIGREENEELEEQEDEELDEQGDEELDEQGNEDLDEQEDEELDEKGTKSSTIRH